MATKIVIRPSGIWNSRAPFSNYYRENRQISIHFNVLVLAASRVRADVLARGKEKDDTSALRWLRRAGRVNALAWLGYRKSLGRTLDGLLAKPTPADLADDLRSALQELYEMMVVKVSSLYEAFTQCWALNYLLTRLEQPPYEWSNTEQRLADKLSPVLSTHIPGWPSIIRAVPWIADELRQLPHIYLDKSTQQPISVPVSNVLNALSVIDFWREYRNLVIHRNGLVSTEFYVRFRDLYEALRRPFGLDIPPIKVRSPLKFSDALPRAMATTHYKAAAHLTKRLIELSGGKRGHIAAPEPESTEGKDSLSRPNPLVMEGDHALSFSWVANSNDEAFQRELFKRLQAEARVRGLKNLPKIPITFQNVG